MVKMKYLLMEEAKSIISSEALCNPITSSTDFAEVCTFLIKYSIIKVKFYLKCLIILECFEL